MPADPPETPESPSTPDHARQEERRESTAEESTLAREDQLKKTEDVRLDMMRSIVTEPLLSRVAGAMREDPEREFEVIIALNETFRGGIEGAMHWIKERAKDWNVTGYQTVSHYVFATIPAVALWIWRRRLARSRRSMARPAPWSTASGKTRR